MYDKNVNRKNSIIEQISTKTFLPKIIEFSTSGLCNRKCIFCPRSSETYEHVNSHLSIDNLEKVVEELSGYNSEYFFLFSGFSEPLLTKNLHLLIGLIKKKLPNSRVEINTNTDLLTQERIRELFEHGLDSVICSIYDDEHRLKEVENLLLSCGLLADQYELRPRYLKKDVDGEAALKEFGITLSNRGGTMENAVFKIDSLSEPLAKPCYYPFYTLFIDYNGDYLMCPHDWSKISKLGNIETHELVEDIWNGQTMENYRKQLLNANRSCNGACKVCDVEGTLMGSREVEEWKQWTK